MDVKTTFLIISDTHTQQGLVIPNEPVDVAIHCGDLTDESKLDEFRAAISLLKQINAPLKLVIAGNHDFTLDTSTYEQKIALAARVSNIEPDSIKETYGDFGEARRLFSDPGLDKDNGGITFLDEGIHHFNLANGARLRVYASPFTASLEADWGFQYKRGEYHDFAVGAEGTGGVDVAITHSPPLGVLDRTADGRRGGCEHLFAAVARARPRMHCFGHIHEGWGARLVTWRKEEQVQPPSHFSAIDNDGSVLLESLATLRPGRWDSPDVAAGKERRLRALRADGCRRTSCCGEGGEGEDGGLPLRAGEQTLFVNAAIEALDDGPQLPWVVELGLPRADRLDH